MDKTLTGLGGEYYVLAQLAHRRLIGTTSPHVPNLKMDTFVMGSNRIAVHRRH